MIGVRLGDRGMATVELAAALPVLILLVLVGLSAVRVGDARVRCVDAAREAARAAARGDPRAVALASQAVPGRARISVLTADGTVTATVSVHVRSLGTVGPTVTVTARASAATEPQATEP